MKTYHDGDTFTRGGRTFKVEFPLDDMGPPWKQCDGHGPVSDWTSRDFYKKPGERILARDRGSYRFYDWAEAIKIAKRDGWGSSALGSPVSYGQHPLGYYHFLLRHWRKPTPGEFAEAAVEEDFKRLKAWYDDEWWYVSVHVTDVKTGEDEWLGGVESEDYEGHVEYAHELADQINARLGPLLKIVCPKCGSDDLTRDACARWSVDDQEWQLTTTYDDATCGACGWEGHDLKEVEIKEEDNSDV